MRAAVASLLFAACTSPCGSAPLGSFAGDARIAIVVTNANGEPGSEPDILEDYAAIALYDADALSLHTHWIDSYTNAVSARFTARSALSRAQRPGTLAYASELTLVSLPFAGEVAEVSIDEEIIDFVEVDGRVFAARADGSIRVIEDGVVARAIPDTAGRLVPIDVDRVAAVQAASLAVVNASGTVTSVDLGASGCNEAVRLGERIAVLCAGTLVLVSLADFSIAGVRDTTLSAELVALAGDWVAGVVRVPDLEDTLVAVHLTSDAQITLHEEAWTTLWGAPLGEGAFVEGVLLVPSVTRGVLRYRLRGEDGAAYFDAASTIVPPSCYQLPARRVLSVAP